MPQRNLIIGLVITVCALTVALYLEIRSPAPELPLDMVALQEKAEQGDASAQLLVADLYERGVLQDDTKSVYWLKKAAEQGHPLGQFTLGLAYITGQGITQDQQAGCELLRKAAAQRVPLDAKRLFDDALDKLCR